MASTSESQGPQAEGYTAGQQPSPVVVVKQRPQTRVIVQRPTPQEDKSAFLRTAALASQVTFSLLSSLYIFMLIYGANRSDETAKKQMMEALKDALGTDDSWRLSFLGYLNFGYRGKDDHMGIGMLPTSVVHVVLLFAIGVAINIARCTPMFRVSTRKSVSLMVFLGLIVAAMLTVLCLTIYRIAEVTKAVEMFNEEAKRTTSSFNKLLLQLNRQPQVQPPELTTGPLWLVDLWAFVAPLVCIPLLTVGWFMLPTGESKYEKAEYARLYGSDAQDV